MNSNDLVFLISYLGLWCNTLHMASGKPLAQCMLSTLVLFTAGLTLGLLIGGLL